MNDVHPVSELSGLRVGYTAFSQDFTHPADRRRFPAYARARGMRIEPLHAGESYDLMMVTRRSDLSYWSQLPPGKGKIIFDLSDSYHEVRLSDYRGLLRGTAKFVTRQHTRWQPNYFRTLDDMCRRADAVICTTASQQDYWGRMQPNMHKILDIQEDLVRHVKQDYRADKIFRLVWEGLPENTRFLELISRPLRALAQRHPVELVVITDPEYFVYMARYIRRDTLSRLRRIFPASVLRVWNRDHLSEWITQCDLAVIPIPLDSPLEAGKPENKLLLFWRMGVPALTSATAAYSNAMREAGLDMVCRSLSDWEQRLEYYIQSEPARHNAGEQGRSHAEAAWGAEAMLDRWDQVMRTLYPQLLSGGTSLHGSQISRGQ